VALFLRRLPDHGPKMQFPKTDRSTFLTVFLWLQGGAATRPIICLGFDPLGRLCD